MRVQYFVKDEGHLGDTEANPPRVGELVVLFDGTLPGNAKRYFQVEGTLRNVSRIAGRPKVSGNTFEERMDSLVEWVENNQGVLHSLAKEGGCNLPSRELRGATTGA